MIVRGPGIAAGKVSRVPVTGTDIYPTVAEWLGVRAELPSRLEGGSLAGLLANGGEGTVSRWHEGLVWHFPHYQVDKGNTPSSAIRVGDWKLVKHYETGEVNLFNLSEDLGETRDLSKKERRPGQGTAQGTNAGVPGNQGWRGFRPGPGGGTRACLPSVGRDGPRAVSERSRP